MNKNNVKLMFSPERRHSKTMSNYPSSCFSRGCSDSSPCDAAKERLEHKMETYGEYVHQDGEGSLVR